MPLMLQLPRSPRKLPLKPEGTFVGRQELRNCPERLFVSRHQCKLTPQPDGQQALLLHTGSNPTLVIRANQSERLLLKPDPSSGQGDRLLLSVGDAFSLLATKPDEAFMLVWQDEDQQGPRDKNNQQQQQQQQHDRTSDQAMQQAPTQELPQQQQPRQQQQQQQQRAAGSSPAARPRSAGAAPSGKAATPPPPAAAAAAAAAEPAAAVAPPPGTPVMLILAGVPGSGKSTFAAALAAGSSRAWVRVNQDSIRGGSGSSRGGSGGSSGGAGKSKRGTREQCVRAAAAALSSGQNVVIDRCNLDAEQRSDFCRLGAARGVAVHLLSLSLEPRLCVARAAARTDHEGGVQGKGAARVVNAMAAQARKAGPPSAAEGLATIAACTSDAQVAAALRRWTAATSGVPKTQQQQQQQQAAAPQSPAAAAAGAPAAGRDSPAKKRQRTASPEKAPLQQQQQQQQQQQKGGSSSAGGAAGAGAAGSSAAAATGSSKNAFSMMMAAAAAKQHQIPGAGGGGGSGSTLQKAKQQPKQQQQSPAAAAAAGRAVPGGGGGWSSELSHIAAAPDRFRSTQSIWHVDERTVGLLDRFPKARCHALLLARQPGLHRASQLTREHLPLMRHMLGVAVGWIQQQQEQLEEGGAVAAAAAAAGAGSAQLPAVPAGWQLGFHSVPSMATLHLHIISTDFDSVCLKTKKHWNSFTSTFFLQLQDVIHTLEANGRLAVDEAAAEELLKQPMRCHRCQRQLANIPQLKQHLREHQD